MSLSKRVLLIIAALIGLESHAKTITIASDEWCPYICNDINNPGYVVEMTKIALEIRIPSQLSKDAIIKSD